ncbi:MAG: PD-(D/E)XK nuclease family protein [Eubacterium sp.]|nr:PD-(D/E)XK nuclease family protein [Eubacterium sp.]
MTCSVEILTGSSGAGKSYTVYRELIEASLMHPEKQYLVLVPEQFTMQTQKELVRMHPRHGLLNVDVLSFHRLAWRVFEEVGGNTLPVLEDLGKSLVVQRVIAGRKNELHVLGRTLSRQGSVSQMKSLISELLQYGVSPEDLEEWQEKQEGSVLAYKLAEIRCVYQGFLDYLQDHYLTTEELPEVLCSVIGTSRLIRGSVIVLDGFTGFTPVQYKVLRELLLLAEKVILPVTLDPREDPMRRGHSHQLFYMSRDMIRRTVELAREVHADIQPIRCLEAGEQSRFSQNAVLRFLEENLFRYRGAVYEGAVLPEGQAAGPERSVVSEKQSRSAEAVCPLEIYEASDPRAELRHIAAQIRRMVREQGYRFRDFAVVTGDLETYGKEAASLFAESGIPCFLDQKQPVLTNPFVECIRAALFMIRKQYSYESVLRFLRSGMTDFTKEETDELENYVLALGIRGRKQYKEAWIKTPEGLDPARMGYLNRLRERFVSETEQLHDCLHDRRALLKDKTEGLYRFLLQYDPQTKLDTYRKHLEAAGERVQAKEYAQIYAAVMDMLDKLVEVLGEEKMGTAAFAEVLDAGFQEMRIGLIPPGEDQVMIGDIERTRLKTIRVLFFAGINEGVIPRPVGAGGILSEMDREKLEKEEAVLAPTAREEMYRQRFYLYLAMTKPSDALRLSYSRTGKNGQTLLPSYLIGTIRQLFPTLPVNREAAEQPETENGRIRLILEALQQLQTRPLTDPEKELLLWLRDQPQGEQQLQQLLEAVQSHNKTSGISRAVAEALYGKDLKNTATRLERFAACAFRHFCDYGLHLKERDIFAFTPADLGNVMHAALERFSLLLQKEGHAWGALSDEQRTDYADRALEEVVHAYGNNILHNTARNAWMIVRMRDMLQRTVWALQVQIARSAFQPSDFEFVFRDDLTAARFRLSDTGTMKLTGRIDRLDLCEKNGTRYVKVIDYKTGNTRFDLNKIVYGLQLQLILYMNAAVENEQKTHPGKQVEPAGVFYYHIEDPFAEAADPAQAEQEILKKLKPDGRCRSEKEILELLDKTLYAGAAGGASDVIPVSVNKDGSLSKYSQTSGAEEFRLICRYTEDKSRELGSRILSGETGVKPVLYGVEKACDWCPYRAVCGFDERIPGYAYTRCRKIPEDEIYRVMKEKS